jgi:pimeloyl-ACP methyl ester carboxylesterase
MPTTRSVALAALPAAAAIALFNRYRRAVEELAGHRTAPPHLPGRVRAVSTTWGRLSYRIVRGTDPGSPLVLVHGWGRSGDSVWWPLLSHTARTVLIVDLPGHGRSLLEGRFTFDLAADAVRAAVADAGLLRPILVGHSMGGPVALTTLRRSGPHDFAGFVAVATSAYWVRPRHQLMVAAAPYLMASTSPILIRAQRAEARRSPEQAPVIAWEYAMRPTRRILEQAASELRGFDARRWTDLALPAATWVVTLEDGVIASADQRASAHHFGIATVDLPYDHPVVGRAPAAVAAAIEESSLAWAHRLPIGIRRRAARPHPAP